MNSAGRRGTAVHPIRVRRIPRSCRPLAWKGAPRVATTLRGGPIGAAGGRGDVVDYRQRLRSMAINQQGVVESEAGLSELGALDPKTLALARLAALVAIGGAGPSFGEQATAAVSAGASADELVDVIVGVASIVGVPRVVAAAPRLALALGFDVEDSVD